MDMETLVDKNINPDCEPQTLSQGPVCRTLVKLAKVSEAVEPEGKFQRRFQEFGA